jgi:hypothetical protein
MKLDHTDGVDDQSLDRCSLSDYNDNAFVTFDLLLLRARKWQRRSNVTTGWPRVERGPLIPPMTMARPWRMLSLLGPWPKASTSPWLSLWRTIDSSCQWTVLP